MISNVVRRRIVTAAIAGMITLATYAVYAVTVVPFVEKEGPEKHTWKGSGGDREPLPDRPGDPRFEQWFPENSWEHNSPLVIETPQAILIFDEYVNLRGGRVRLTPCSVVMLPGNQADQQRQIQEAIVLRAPQGANLQFDREFSIENGDFGEIIGGDLMGDVTIRGAGKKPTPDDDLFLATSNIRMSGDVISTVEDVTFRWGGNHGQGTDLSIALLPEDDGQREASHFAGLATLELRRNVSIHLLLSDEDEDESQTAESTNIVQAKTDDPDNPFPFSKDTPLDINCGGAFRFDFIELEATFNEGVIVERPFDNGGMDTLHCQRLLIGFREMQEEEEAGDRAFARMEVRRLEATGEPAVLAAPSKQAYAEGNRLAYDFLSGKVNLESTSEVHFRQEGNELHARNLDYQPGEDGRIGKFVAQGPGWLDWDMRDKDQPQKNRRFRASWSHELSSIPPEDLQIGDGLQIISVQGDAIVNVTDMGRIAADQIHAWVYEEMPPAGATDPDGERPKPEIVPKRMLAVQNAGAGDSQQPMRVSFQSTQLTGRTQRLEALFVESGTATPGNAVARMAKPFVPREVVRHEVAYRGFNASYYTPQDQVRGGNSSGRSPLPWSSGGSSAAAGQTLPTGRAEALLSSAPRAPQITGAPLVPIQLPPRGTTTRPPGGSPVVEPGGRILPQLAGKRRFDVSGQTIQVQLIQQEDTAEVSQVTILKDAILRETQTEKPDELPMLVRGDVLHVEQAHLPTSLVTVAGAPAHVEGRGLGLTANRINMDRGRNRLWIDEPGLMTLLVDRDLQGQELRQPMPLEITWRKRFEFDGLRAVFDVGVVARRQEEQLQTQRLEVVMSEVVDFGETRGNETSRDRPEIAQIICREGVYLEAQRFDKHGELEAIEKMELADLAIDQKSGALSGGGPGWITRVGKSDSRSGSVLPGAVAPPTTRQPRVDEEPKILYLRVDFQQGMTGNIHRKQVIFQHQVVCVYGEVEDWNQTIDGDRPSEFGPQTVRLRSDQLQVTEMPALNGAPPWRELVASGNTTSEGKMFTANAERITYAENKQLLTMEGNSVRPAEFYLQRRVGDRPARVSARKVTYNSKTGEYKLAGLDSVDGTVPPRGGGGR